MFCRLQLIQKTHNEHFAGFYSFVVLNNKCTGVRMIPTVTTAMTTVTSTTLISLLPSLISIMGKPMKCGRLNKGSKTFELIDLACFS